MSWQDRGCLAQRDRYAPDKYFFLICYSLLYERKAPTIRRNLQRFARCVFDPFGRLKITQKVN